VLTLAEITARSIRTEEGRYTPSTEVLARDVRYLIRLLYRYASYVQATRAVDRV
jgi:hypothetical protein